MVSRRQWPRDGTGSNEYMNQIIRGVEIMSPTFLENITSAGTKSIYKYWKSLLDREPERRYFFFSLCREL